MNNSGGPLDNQTCQTEWKTAALTTEEPMWLWKPSFGSFCCGQPFVCQVWLSSGPPGSFTFSDCAWLWNWLICVNCHFECQGKWNFKSSLELICHVCVCVCVFSCQACYLLFLSVYAKYTKWRIVFCNKCYKPFSQKHCGIQPLTWKSLKLFATWRKAP